MFPERAAACSDTESSMLASRLSSMLLLGSCGRATRLVTSRQRRKARQQRSVARSQGHADDRTIRSLLLGV